MQEQTQSLTGNPAANTAVVPVPKLEDDFYDWYGRHNAKCREAAKGNHDIIFIGDSITHLFEGDPNVPNRGERVWQDYFGTRNVFNLGFGWDRTQNVLWRLSHGEFAGQTPRVVALLIGTNNLTGTSNAPANTPSEIAAGIQAICQQVVTASPGSRILLMGIFPRGTVNDPLRGSIRELNELLRERSELWHGVHFMDIGPRFLTGDGAIPGDIMNDGVHPTGKGYRIWADAIAPYLCA